MTWLQFNLALDQLGFSQVGFAKKINKTDRQVRNWAAGRWPVPTEIAMLLNLMIRTGTRPEDLRS
jgi:DNA-binding transcriptional regulator YiaG